MSLIRAISVGAVSLFLTVVIAGCYPGSGSFTADETDIVATVYDTTANFQANKTFVVPDTVIHVVDPDEEDPIDIPRNNDELMINTVKENLRSLGYSELENPSLENLPDIFVTVQVTATEWTGYVSYPWYGWWGWYPWYPPGWGPPYYPCCTTTYSYTTGTILLDMIDVSESDAENIVIPWNAALNGVAAGGQGGTRIKTRLDQAFNQSPYLKVQ
ncbi:DUF4136 domain-containing protein [Bacteroidota bacterium]